MASTVREAIILLTTGELEELTANHSVMENKGSVGDCALRALSQ